MGKKVALRNKTVIKFIDEYAESHIDLDNGLLRNAIIEHFGLTDKQFDKYIIKSFSIILKRCNNLNPGFRILRNFIISEYWDIRGEWGTKNICLFDYISSIFGIKYDESFYKGTRMSFKKIIKPSRRCFGDMERMEISTPLPQMSCFLKLVNRRVLNDYLEDMRYNCEMLCHFIAEFTDGPRGNYTPPTTYVEPFIYYKLFDILSEDSNINIPERILCVLLCKFLNSNYYRNAVGISDISVIYHHYGSDLNDADKFYCESIFKDLEKSPPFLFDKILKKPHWQFFDIIIDVIYEHSILNQLMKIILIVSLCYPIFINQFARVTSDTLARTDKRQVALSKINKEIIEYLNIEVPHDDDENFCIFEHIWENISWYPEIQKKYIDIIKAAIICSAKSYGFSKIPNICYTKSCEHFDKIMKKFARKYLPKNTLRFYHLPNDTAGLRPSSLYDLWLSTPLETIWDDIRQLYVIRHLRTISKYFNIDFTEKYIMYVLPRALQMQEYDMLNLSSNTYNSEHMLFNSKLLLKQYKKKLYGVGKFSDMDKLTIHQSDLVQHVILCYFMYSEKELEIIYDFIAKCDIQFWSRDRYESERALYPYPSLFPYASIDAYTKIDTNTCIHMIKCCILSSKIGQPSERKNFWQNSLRNKSAITLCGMPYELTQIIAEKMCEASIDYHSLQILNESNHIRLGEIREEFGNLKAVQSWFCKGEFKRIERHNANHNGCCKTPPTNDKLKFLLRKKLVTLSYISMCNSIARKNGYSPIANIDYLDSIFSQKTRLGYYCRPPIYISRMSYSFHTDSQECSSSKCIDEQCDVHYIRPFITQIAFIENHLKECETNSQKLLFYARLDQ